MIATMMQKFCAVQTINASRLIAKYDETMRCSKKAIQRATILA